MNAEWKRRIGHWIRTLRDDLYAPLGEISWEAFCTMDHLSVAEAKQGPFVPVSPGFTWGHTWEYCWFKGYITLPEEAEGQRIVLNLKPNGESTIFINETEFGTYRADWVDQPHQFMEDNTIAFVGKAGATYEILMETYAGQYFPDTHECAVGPILPGSYQDPLVEGARRTLGVCTYGIWNEDAYQLYMDVDTLDKLLEALDDTSLRAAKVAKALEKFTLIVEFEQGREERIRTYKEAREALRPVLEAKNGSTVPQLYAVGNSHLDLAWLWPMAETHRKTARTFAAQLPESADGAVTLFNSLSFERSAVVVLPDRFAEGAVTLEGAEVPVQKVNGVVKAMVLLPSCGTLTLVPKAAAASLPAAATITEAADGYIMENAKIIAKINKKGEVTSYVLKESGREFAASPVKLPAFI